MRDTVNLYHIDHTNVGDFNSSPAQYFHFPGKTCLLDVSDARNFDVENKNVIIGGGGLLYPGTASVIERIIQRCNGKLIAWGMGHNEHIYATRGSVQLVYPEFMKKFHLVGIRDYGQGFRWVPCASCMHTGFDRTREITRDVVIYEHKIVKIPIRGLPRMDNSCPDINKVLDFLGSAETVLTSTYHGMYWSILLKKKVLVFPISSRFYASKYTVPLFPVDRWRLTFCSRFRKAKTYYCPTHGWRGLLKKCLIHEEALDECRKANVAYSAQVNDLLANG